MPMATSARRNTGPHRSRTVIKRPLAHPVPPPRARATGTAGPSVNALVHELGTCVTEADLVQVLYRGLPGKFGYDAINLQVLEREGWYHSLPMDAGVLQDLRRRPVRESIYAKQFTNPRTTVVPIESNLPLEKGKGPGRQVRSKLAIWVPVMHQSELIGSVIYHTYRKRRVPSAELEFLEDVHGRLGILLANASLNELTRNQARRLQALNGVARAMTSSLDEGTVMTGLYGTLRELLPVDSLEMVTLQDPTDRVRHLHIEGDGVLSSRWLSTRSPLVGTARNVVAGNKPLITHDPHSSLWVPLKEGGVARGALGIKCSRPYAYEDSTAAFLELVCDEVALALRNARSYEAIEDHRRRLEVVNSVGRRLASSLDRWSIMRTLREELSATLNFDGFILATITRPATALWPRATSTSPVSRRWSRPSPSPSPVRRVRRTRPASPCWFAIPHGRGHSRAKTSSAKSGRSVRARPCSCPGRPPTGAASPAPSSGCRSSAASGSPPCSPSSPTASPRSTTGT